MPDIDAVITVRRAQAQDLERLAEIDAVSNQSAWTRGMLEKELKNPLSVCAVAVCGGEPAGFGVAWAVEGVAQLHQIAIAPEHRRKGIGSLLLDYISAWAKERGCLKMELEFRKANCPARFFYEKMGFKVVGERKKFYENNEDAVLLSCDIK